jgi:hypothetical protein
MSQNLPQTKIGEREREQLNLILDEKTGQWLPAKSENKREAVEVEASESAEHYDTRTAISDLLTLIAAIATVWAIWQVLPIAVDVLANWLAEMLTIAVAALARLKAFLKSLIETALAAFALIIIAYFIFSVSVELWYARPQKSDTDWGQEQEQDVEVTVKTSQKQRQKKS